MAFAEAAVEGQNPMTLVLSEIFGQILFAEWVGRKTGYFHGGALDTSPLS
jgi:hypothetical protein